MSNSLHQAIAVAVAAMLVALAGGRVNEGRDRALATDVAEWLVRRERPASLDD